jgi:hypothetical protein
MRQSEKDRGERKVNKVIDAMVDLQDMGLGCDRVSRILELANDLRRQILDFPVTEIPCLRKPRN